MSAEFSKNQIGQFKIANFRVLADERAECGPYQIERTEKRIKVKNIETSKVRYFKRLTNAIEFVCHERKYNFNSWALQFDRDHIYSY